MNDRRAASRPWAAPTAKNQWAAPTVNDQHIDRGHGPLGPALWERAMRAKVGLRALSACSGLAALLLVLLPARAEPTTPAQPAKAQAAPDPNPDRPEYRARALPKDSFNPSEQVQEDQPVPFPDDV